MEVFLNNPYLAGLAILCLINLVLLAMLAWRLSRYRKTQAELLAGEEVKNLEDVILKNKKTLATHNKNLKELGQILEELVDSNRLNIQKSGLVRFNPFADAGGNLSFTLALLDGHDNGIVISSLHGREGTRIYAKSVTNGGSEHHLTGEEKQAIAEAKLKE